MPAFFVEQEGGAAADTPMNPSPFELLFVPMKLHGKVAMVMLVAVPPPPASSNDTGLVRTYLNFLLRMVGTIEPVLSERHLSLLEKDRGQSSRLVRFADQVHKHLFVDQVAVDIANLVRDVMEAQRVTVELYPRIGKKVLAVSNVDEPNKRANVLRVQRLIFDYVRDRHVPVLLDREAAKQLVSDPVLQDAAAAYFAATEFAAFIAVPIKADEGGGATSPVMGVVLVEYAGTAVGGGAQGHFAMLGDVVRLCTGSVANAFEVESVPLFKAFHKMRGLWRKPMSSKRAMIMSIVGVVLVAAVIVGVIPFDFAIKADCQIRPSVQLSIVAPVEQRIIEVPVRAGEHVYRKGDTPANGEMAKPLAVFDATELIAQRAGVMAQLDELSVVLEEAGKKGDMTEIRKTREQIKQAQSRRDVLDYQIEACTVWSPIEGVVLTENVEQKRWSVPRKSEQLMEVASFSDWELVVDVPESEAATVRGALDRASRQAAAEGKAEPGIEVDYILYPWPDRKWPVRSKGVASLLPASMQNKNANVFRLQVKLDPKDLPPGIAMSGVTGRAKIHVGTKPLGAQWTRGAVRLLRMTMLF
ncbi:MAG: efflux RND transporter periplasmic adaptor subunit [Phycisphaerales bacterium]|nr:efflux RND transporter periplasmic adaptor subunit [Phycisphaerales bacterium]